jgi:hypothetical protein
MVFAALIFLHFVTGNLSAMFIVLKGWQITEKTFRRKPQKTFSFGDR